jgi:hypothetical protein
VRIRHHNFILLAILATLCSSIPVQAEQDLPSIEKNVRALGINARINPESRDAAILQIAETLHDLAAKKPDDLRRIQFTFQTALLLSCDRDIYETLQPETIEAVDNALESIFTIEDVTRDLRWEPLVYAYGFFNRDVTAAEIIEVRNATDALSDDRRQRMYSIYPHGFDALAKPLSLGHLADPTQTLPALEIVVPMLRDIILEEAKPGRAFHPPTHALLVLSAIYDYWEDHPGPERDLVLQHLGTRDEFIAMLSSRVLGGLPDPDNLPDFHYGFYAYCGQYYANAFARMDARETVDVLKKSIPLYEAHVSHPSLIAYTKRALVSLGDSDERAEIETLLDTDENTRAVGDLVWIIRNVQGEGKTYAMNTLAKHLGCTPREALIAYFEDQLKK